VPIPGAARRGERADAGEDDMGTTKEIDEANVWLEVLKPLIDEYFPYININKATISHYGAVTIYRDKQCEDPVFRLLIRDHDVSSVLHIKLFNLCTKKCLVDISISKYAEDPGCDMLKAAKTIEEALKTAAKDEV
jgi:hypothetical protein